ncbi:hypothetical protein Catovirus_1_85 [Catovirus CTV1]|uniref:Uncharacterized protein n=1 Tax=Catovirus CTV1 TaxID=1977631 RepID=A0A1V0S8K4_9VIRU|nr:hypothetical protein Catovirus_1_85 [Catovirus CTV1]
MPFTYKYNLNYDYSENDSEENEACEELIFVHSDTNYNLSVSFETMPKKSQWENLLRSLENGSYCLNFKPSNGVAYIKGSPEWVEFKVAKSGDGRGGYVELKVSTQTCKDALKDVLKHLN